MLKHHDSLHAHNLPSRHLKRISPWREILIFVELKGGRRRGDEKTGLASKSFVVGNV